MRARVLVMVSVLWMLGGTVWATPQFARKYDVRCGACHTVPPMLNESGLSFQATGYLPSGGAVTQGSERAAAPDRTVPLAAWLTWRHEDRDGGPEDLFLPKVELISGGRLAKRWSYFVEWRVVSDSLQSDGTLRDRGGRFEDLFVEWRPESNRHAVKIGQYRSLNQVDVSLRLSASEPLLFRNGVRTGTDADPRIDGLSTFSPSSRSPSVGYAYQSMTGEQASDGLFFFATAPFVGEFSIPLSPEASVNASNELGEAKGLYLESFLREGLRSVGLHVFLGRDDAWVATALGTWNWDDIVLTAGLGLDDEQGRGTRERASAQCEYLLLGSPRYRGAAGLRVEDVRDDGNRAAWVPYFVVSAPTTRYTFLLQLEYKNQDGADVFVADLSALF